MAAELKHNPKDIVDYVHENAPCSMTSVYKHFNMRRQNGRMALKRLVDKGVLEVAFHQSVYRGHLTPFYRLNPQYSRPWVSNGAEVQNLLNSVWR